VVMRQLQFWLGCGAMSLVAVALLMAGSQPMPSAPVPHPPTPYTWVVITGIDDIFEPMELLGCIDAYTVARDSGLYREPMPPADLAPDAAAEYTDGYRLGWLDEADDVGFFFDGTNELSAMEGSPVYHPRGRSDAFMRGLRAGREQAKRDRETFRRDLEKQLAFDHYAVFRVPGTDVEIAVGQTNDPPPADGARCELVLLSMGRIRARHPLRPDPDGRSRINLYRRADGDYLLIDMNERWFRVSPKTLTLTLTHLGRHGKEQPEAEYLGCFAFRNDSRSFRFRRADGIPLRPYCSK